MEYLIIILLLFLMLILSIHWKKKLGEAYSAAARYAPVPNLRREYSRKAVLAGNREARKIFSVSIAQENSRHRPLKVFKCKKIPCVFTGLYFPARYTSYLSGEQQEFCKSVLDFKGGKNDGVRFLINGINGLSPKPGTVILFMPCSTQQKYWRRFKKMADYVDNECPQLVKGIGYVRYMGERESLHLQKDRTNLKPEKNYFFKEDLNGKEVLLVDDILTTGNSLQEFRKEVEANGGKVMGAVFAAETFRMPGKIRCYLEALCWSEPVESGHRQETQKNEAACPDRSRECAGNLNGKGTRKVLDMRGKSIRPTGKDEIPEDDDWMPDRTIVCGNSLVNLYYGVRNGKRVVVKKEVLPLDAENGEADRDDLKEIDRRI